MMGRREDGQGQFFYAFDLDKVVPLDHLVRQIDRILDLSWVHKELAPYYSHTGRPSIDPELMIRMLIIGYVFAIRSERVLCRDVPKLGPLKGKKHRPIPRWIRSGTAPSMPSSKIGPK
jgi:transposase